VAFPVTAKKVVVLGMMSRSPVAGMVWLTMQYVVGLRRLGYDVYYVEPHAGARGEDPGPTVDWLARVFNQFDLNGRWAYNTTGAGGECYGLSSPALSALYRAAALLLNLHGSAKPTEELTSTNRLVFVGTDPGMLEIELDRGETWAVEYLEPHCAFFTWAENFGRQDCLLPVSPRFDFIPTCQPVLVDHWQRYGSGPPRSAYSTIGNWRQDYREVEFLGETFYWSKHREFLRFIDLPDRTGAAFDLALGSCPPDDRDLLERHGWRVLSAAAYSNDIDEYGRFIGGSRGEFTVAKGQYARLRTGWVGDRTPTYLAAGRPAILLDTGFGSVLPTARGLFSFTSEDDVADAVDAIASDYEAQSLAALTIANEHFRYDVVLGRMLDLLSP
jgi:hypothetical protein